MSPATPLSFTLSTQQVLSVSLNLHAVTDRQLLVTIAGAQREAEKAAEIAVRTYHLGQQRTRGLDYDDRLTTRLKCCAKTARTYLDRYPQPAGLRHARLGKKYVVSEQAVREFLGDLQAAA